MDEIAVSVIMICYNQAQYIEQAVSSVLMQKTNFRYELLIGDDASTDETPEILKKLQKQHPNIIRLFLRKHNLGATRNAYELLMEAKGKYLASCEGDDYWISKEKLQIQVDFLINNPQYIGCSHDCIIVNQNGIPLSRQRLRWVCGKTRYKLKDFKGIKLPGQAATIVRRNIYLDHTCDYSIFYQAHPQIGDRTTALIYASQGDFYHLKSKMSCYRKEKSSKSLTPSVFNSTMESLMADFDYTKTLQKYAETKLHVKVDFSPHVKDLFVSAVFHYARTRNQEWIFLAKKILRSEKNHCGFFLYVPFGVVKKIIYTLFYLD